MIEYFKPAVNGDRQFISTLSVLPDYVEELIDYLNDSPQNGGVWVLPKVGSMRVYNWEQGYS